MPYTEKSIQELERERSTISAKFEGLMLQFVYRPFANPRAKEFAQQGFPRRLKTMVRCLENVFRTIPPNIERLPSSDELSDAAINTQAFVFNTSGCLDNLAWIWVCEKDIKRPNGTALPPSQIGLGPTNVIVRESLSPDFHKMLQGFDQWFKGIEDYRHALAHRIPLYIPPYEVATKDKETYLSLDTKKLEALRDLDLAAHTELTALQDALCSFNPVMMHSFGEKAQPVVIHPTLIAAFNTVEVIAKQLLADLDA